MALYDLYMAKTVFFISNLIIYLSRTANPNNPVQSVIDIGYHSSFELFAQ